MTKVFIEEIPRGQGYVHAASNGGCGWAVSNTGIKGYVSGLYEPEEHPRGGSLIPVWSCLNGVKKGALVWAIQ